MTAAGKKLLAIDPGTSGKGCAWAEFDGLALQCVGFERGGRTPSREIDVVIVERPEYQGARSNNSRTADLISLAWNGARVAYGLHARAVVELTPRQWKGSARKPQHHRRVWAALSEGEKVDAFGVDEAILVGVAIETAATKGALDAWQKSGGAYYPQSFKTHNLLDAIGLGLHHLGRLPA